MNWRNWIVLGIVWNMLLTAAHAEDKWVADEIFLQISEMRKEIQQLQQKVTGLEQQLAQQQPKSVPIDLTGSEAMTLGNKAASIAILEFSDYECPFCTKHYQKVLPKLREQYIDTGRVKYVMKDFPLEFHSLAKKSALASRCAGEQGHYWEMHNAIFDAHGQVTDQLIAQTVQQNKLNSKALQKCIDNPQQLQKVQRDIAQGTSLGVQGTPAFLVGEIKDNQVINYKRLDGVQSFETFAGLIDSFKK